jgi:hypothetical protein
MTFTDVKPSFPHQSSEAKRQLGIPDRPALHLAITSLAERLLLLASGSAMSERNVRITALHMGSEGVLMSLPWECIVFLFCERVGLPGDQAASDQAYHSHQTNWLKMATERLSNEGFAAGSKIDLQ